MVQHFMDRGHTLEDFKFVVLEEITCKGDSKIDLHRFLLQCETYWIFRLNTLAPNGMKIGIDYSVFL